MHSLTRSRWAAIGAAVAVTLGAGGVSLTQAAVIDGQAVAVLLDQVNDSKRSHAVIP